MRTVSLFFFFFFSRVVRLGARGFSDQASHQRQQLGPCEGGAKDERNKCFASPVSKSIVYFKICIFFVVVVVAYFTWR